MNDKEQLEEIKKRFECFKTTKSVEEFEEIASTLLLDYGEWLIKQAEKMIKVREIYENGGEAWQDCAEDAIFDRGVSNE